MTRHTKSDTIKIVRKIEREINTMLIVKVYYTDIQPLELQVKDYEEAGKLVAYANSLGLDAKILDK